MLVHERTVLTRAAGLTPDEPAPEPTGTPMGSAAGPKSAGPT